MTYDKSFKEEAVRLSEEIGVKKASEQLGVPYHTLTGWRRNERRYSTQAYVGSGHKRVSADPKDQRIYELEKENRERQRANEILQEALGFFAKNRRK